VFFSVFRISVAKIDMPYE